MSRFMVRGDERQAWRGRMGTLGDEGDWGFSADEIEALKDAGAI